MQLQLRNAAFIVMAFVLPITAEAAKYSIEIATIDQQDIDYDVVETKLEGSRFRIIYGKRHTASLGYIRTEDDSSSAKFSGYELLGSMAIFSSRVFAAYIDVGGGAGEFKYKPFRNENDVVFYSLGASLSTPRTYPISVAVGVSHRWYQDTTPNTQCRDGSTSESIGSGTCSSHSGIAFYNEKIGNGNGPVLTLGFQLNF